MERSFLPKGKINDRPNYHLCPRDYLLSKEKPPLVKGEANKQHAIARPQLVELWHCAA
jgi:hypothetical protein